MKTYVIAEMACSHDGKPELARTIIEGAGKAGADAIQFQIWEADRIVIPSHPDLPILKKLEMSGDQWTELAQFTMSNFKQMEIIACVYDASSLGLTEKIGVHAYKLHTSDLSNPDLVREVARTGKRIDLSVGGSTLDEITQAIAWIEEEGGPETWLMYGLQNFPTNTEEARLGFLKTLQNLFQKQVGYQDHTEADSPAAMWLPAAAQGAGIKILEKHITHDRSLKGADHQAALNPDEFGTFVQMVRTLDEAITAEIPQPFTDAEKKYRKYSKKSLVVASDLEAGHTLTADDLLAMRIPEPALPPDQKASLLGKTLKGSIQAFEPVTGDLCE